MNEFISNILSRHLNPVNNIIPRLPGKFEPVNFPAANTADLSANIDTVQEISMPQVTTSKAGKEHSSETNFNDKKALTPQANIISNSQVVEQLHNDAIVFPEKRNADQAPDSKNIISFEHEFTGKKKVNQETLFEILNKQEIPLHSEIKPNNVKSLNEKPFNDLEQQEMQGIFLINEVDDTDIPEGKDGPLHQHISILKKKIVNASTERKNNVSEDKKAIQAGLIKPVMNNLNVRTNLNVSPVPNEQPISSVIKVSIGRIEVRAVTTAAPAKVNRAELQKPNLTLDEYLKRRNGTEK